MTGPRKPIDWEKIEAEFRAGQLSTREISRQYEISEGAIRKRAKAKGWEPDLSKKVRARAKTKLVQELGSDRGGTQEGGTHDGTHSQRVRTETETIERAAERQLQSLREHHIVIGRGRGLTLRLLDELDATTTHLGEIEDLIGSETKGDLSPRRRDAMLKAVSLPSRAVVIKDLSAAAKNWITLERQALGVDDDIPTEGIIVRLTPADADL